MSRKLGQSFGASPRLIFYIAQSFTYRKRLAKQFQLLWPNALRAAQFLSWIETTLLQELFDEWQCHMTSVFAADERNICRPVHARNRSRNEARFEGGKLVDQSNAIILFDHPLYVGWCGCRI